MGQRGSKADHPDVDHVAAAELVADDRGRRVRGARSRQELARGRNLDRLERLYPGNAPEVAEKICS